MQKHVHLVRPEIVVELELFGTRPARPIQKKAPGIEFIRLVKRRIETEHGRQRVVQLKLCRAHVIDHHRRTLGHNLQGPLNSNVIRRRQSMLKTHVTRNKFALLQSQRLVNR